MNHDDDSNAETSTAAIADDAAPVTSALRDGVAVLTLQYRPYNLIGPRLMGAILTEVTSAKAAGARAILIRSALRHFSAGADLDLFEPHTDRTERTEPSSAPRVGALEFLRALESVPLPVVAAVHGACLGGGFELALACDLIVAAASAKIGSVEVTLGLNPLMGAVQRQAQRAGAARAKELSMLGRRYDPATLERWGLINLVVPDDALDDAAFALAAELAAGPTLAHAATKALAQIAVNEGVDAADARMSELQKPIWASEDLTAGLASFRKNGPGNAQFSGR